MSLISSLTRGREPSAPNIRVDIGFLFFLYVKSILDGYRLCRPVRDNLVMVDTE